MPENASVELKALFDKPPKEVIEFFKQKGIRGGNKHWDWSDTLYKQHDRAFVVSKVSSIRVLAEIRASLLKCLENGTPYHEFKKSILPTLNDPKKADGAILSDRRLRQIYDINMKTAYDAGQHARMMENAELTPYWRYRTLPPGPMRREDHQQLNNLVFRYDDPFWLTHKPRNGWGCKCWTEALDKRLLERTYKRPLKEVVKESSPADFESKVVKVQGKELTVTGYKAGKTTVYPDAGWDYNPGDYAWRTKQLFADEIVKLPKGAARDAFQKQLQGSFKADFSQFVDVTDSLGMKDNKQIAIALMNNDLSSTIDGREFKLKKGARVIHLDTPLLLIDASGVIHGLRPDKNAKDKAMPRSLYQSLPDLLMEYEPVLEENGGLLYFSKPFEENSEVWQWKIVFEPLPFGTKYRYLFRTATKVPNGTIPSIMKVK